MQHTLPCDHHGTWASHPPIPLSMPAGALVVTVMYCTLCGYVEYRSPPIKEEDEEALGERMKLVEHKRRLLRAVEKKKDFTN